MSLRPPPPTSSRISHFPPDDPDRHAEVLLAVLSHSKSFDEPLDPIPSPPLVRPERAHNTMSNTRRSPNRKSVRLPEISTGNASYRSEHNPATTSYSSQRASKRRRPHIPSCSLLPPNWNTTHDRFIAYLATHAPLLHGKVPPGERARERWGLEEIGELLKERFGVKIKPAVIEQRLWLLDVQGDNDYFDMRYGAYKDEEWGKGI